MFILADEWLGVVLCLYLWKTEDRAFWPVLITWAVLVYAISYPWYWLSYRQRSAEEMSLRRDDLNRSPLAEMRTLGWKAEPLVGDEALSTSELRSTTGP
jgi:hypothetical protein